MYVQLLVLKFVEKVHDKCWKPYATFELHMTTWQCASWAKLIPPDNVSMHNTKNICRSIMLIKSENVRACLKNEEN